MSELCEKFFVYGTLRPGIKAAWESVVHNNALFRLKYSNAKLFGVKLYYIPNLNCPSIYFTNNQADAVFGEIVETNNFKLTERVFDQIEEYPKIFNKKIQSCFNIDLKLFEPCWVYYLNDEHSTIPKDLNANKQNNSLIEGGDFKRSNLL